MDRAPRRHRASLPPETSRLRTEVLVGGAVGMVAGATFACHLGASMGMLLFGAVLGWATGVVVGVLLWVSTAEFPEAPIPPVRPSSADEVTRVARPAPTVRTD